MTSFGLRVLGFFIQVFSFARALQHCILKLTSEAERYPWSRVLVMNGRLTDDSPAIRLIAEIRHAEADALPPGPEKRKKRSEQLQNRGRSDFPVN